MSANIAISELFQLDRCPAGNALHDAIGDSYLYSGNPVFANIRDVVLHFGYRFSSEPTELWRDYQVLPLLTLHRIIQDKVIPYSDNRSPLARLMARDPEASLPASFIESNIKRNYTLHEAAHCIASTVFQLNAALPASTGGSDRKMFVVREILSEAFANSVETLAAAVDPSPIPAFMFSLNSYMRGSAEGKDVLDTARRVFGDDLALLLLFLCYFEANLTLREPTEAETLAMLAAAGVPLSLDLDTELIARLMNIGFELNRSFRESTALTYFSLLGYEAEFQSLRDAHWLAEDRNQEFARRIGGLLGDVALRGLNSQIVRGHLFSRAGFAQKVSC